MYASLIEQSCGGHALAFSKEAATGKCLSIISAQDAERTMLTDLGASIHLPGLGSFEADLRDTTIAHFTGYTLLGGAMKDTVLTAMAIAKESGAQVSLDAADPFVVHQIRDTFWQALRDYATVVFLNEEEARSLAERDDPEEACRHIADAAGLHTVCVKLGRQGSIVLVDGELHRVPIFAVKAIDTTGAGDSYAGGYLYGLSRGWSPDRCGALATRVAGLTVAQIGAVVQDAEALNAALAAVG
jgi:sugar/nucleoside kinase (ribokinase family)